MHGWVCNPSFLPGHSQVTQAPTLAQVPIKAVDPRTAKSTAWAKAEDKSGTAIGQTFPPQETPDLNEIPVSG